LNYYVYYKIEPARLEEVRAAVEKLFAALERQCGVKGRWMRRRDDPATCMEVYEGITHAAQFEATLVGATVGFPFARKIEIFECA
jgi:hypothetical protein